MDAERLRRLDHDARTPLVLIGGFADVLAGDLALTLAQRQDFARRIKDAAGDLRRLLDEVRTEARERS